MPRSNPIRDFHQANNAWKHRHELWPAPTGPTYNSTAERFTGFLPRSKARARTALSYILCALGFGGWAFILFAIPRLEGTSFAPAWQIAALGWCFFAGSLFLTGLITLLIVRMTDHTLSIEARGIRYVHGTHDLRIPRESIAAMWLRNSANFQLQLRDGREVWLVGGHDDATRIANEAARRLGIPLTTPP